MSRCLALLVVALAACGSNNQPPPPATLPEKCARVYERLEPVLEQAGKGQDRDEWTKSCLDTVTKSPGHNVWLDCILRIDDMSDDHIRICEALDRQAVAGHEMMSGHRPSSTSSSMLSGQRSSAPVTR